MVAIRKHEALPDLDDRRSAPRHLHLVPTGAGPTTRSLAATFRRRRVAVGVLAAVLSVSLLRAASSSADGLAVSPEDAVVRVVQPGDTYWSIATSLDADHDVREVVDALAEANGGRSLQVGDRITVPG